MIYCFVCKDGPEGARLRRELLDEHLQHIERVMPHLPVGGPVVGKDGKYCASILMIEADTEEGAWALFNQDPYAKAEMWASIEVFPFKAVAGTWVGGRAW